MVASATTLFILDEFIASLISAERSGGSAANPEASLLAGGFVR